MHKNPFSHSFYLRSSYSPSKQPAQFTFTLQSFPKLVNPTVKKNFTYEIRTHEKAIILRCVMYKLVIVVDNSWINNEIFKLRKLALRTIIYVQTFIYGAWKMSRMTTRLYMIWLLGLYYQMQLSVCAWKIYDYHFRTNLLHFNVHVCLYCLHLLCWFLSFVWLFHFS